ncbi:MAG: gamma-glutamyltransferase family protein [Planctomycetaceae bacterium]|nr:gamma-glutamyltransferase family protein [Planctomycetaceae bacterium]
MDASAENLPDGRETGGSPLDWSLPYDARRPAVCGSMAVATSQPLAAQAGLEILRRGGSAADAAVATAAAMTVLEPTTNGIGGDAFVLGIFGGEVVALNASGRSPGRQLRSALDGRAAMTMRGWSPVTVPGAVSGWVALWKRFGKLPFADLMEPAIRFARDGYLVAPRTAELWARAYPSMSTFAEWKRVFAPNGRAPFAAERVVFPDHARTLESIARSEGASFYTGELAKAIADAARADGAFLDERDLASHAPQWVKPVEAPFGSSTMLQIPPNGQGIAAEIARGILDACSANPRFSDLSPDCADSVHLAAEAMKLAFRTAHREVGDPASMRVKPEELLARDFLAKLAAEIDPTKAKDFDHGPPRTGGTILLCAADRDGNMVSMIQSNYTGWGSGIVIPGTGIAMQNRGACFTLERGHVNEYAPSKLPYHTIIPGMLVKRDANGAARPHIAFGCMGGYMQPQGQLQIASRLEDHRANPQAALDAPRWQVSEGLRLDVEPGFPDATLAELRARGHEVKVADEKSITFGRAQCIQRVEHGYIAASDARGDAQAVVA